ncbi:hypothetical protein RB195_016029 [Necator americanus]|uniref:BPTI/Kunitz inhibitor domain-containing protein n=1 Tax=Necator americanus TaxID=51031 RepID=A0ABR1E785_NECAM
MICSSPTHLPGIQCLAYFERYTYNREKNICEMFVYDNRRESARMDTTRLFVYFTGTPRHITRDKNDIIVEHVESGTCSLRKS